jgi:ethanolamine transporter EutH
MVAHYRFEQATYLIFSRRSAARGCWTSSQLLHPDRTALAYGAALMFAIGLALSLLDDTDQPYACGGVVVANTSDPQTVDT